MAKKLKTTYEEYLKLKEKTVERSYSERFKNVRFSLYWFSWIGNIFSIFLAFFFVKSLFETSFSEVGTSIYVLGGIIIFLSLFEFLKRYIFGLFSGEYLKDKHTIFRSNMITFLLSVVLIVSASFYLSLNGAKKFVDNKKIEVKSKTCKSIPKSNYEGSIPSYYKQKCDYYVFNRILNDFKTIWIMGFISKEDFENKRRKIRKGETDQSNGLVFKENAYNIFYHELNSIREFKNVLMGG